MVLKAPINLTQAVPVNLGIEILKLWKILEIRKILEMLKLQVLEIFGDSRDYPQRFQQF